MRPFQSTPSARRATRDFDSTFILHDISIHALREEGDLAVNPEYMQEQAISIHALREEGDRPSRQRSAQP